MATASLDAGLLATAASDPHRVVFRDERGAFTAAEFAVRAYLLGQLIGQRTSATTVGVCMPSCKEYPLAAFAVFFAGKTLVPINFLLHPRELQHVVADSGLDLIVASSHFRRLLEPLNVDTLFIEELADMPAPDAPVRPVASKAADVAALLYTSGTTSLPKGVRLGHDNLLAQTSSIAEGISEAGISLSEFNILSALPLFHTFAFTVCVVLPALTPARVAYLPQFDPASMLEGMKRYDANVMLAVPSMFRMISRAALRARVTGNDLGLRLAIAGGERLPPEVAAEFNKVFGMPLYEGFGLTEHGPVVSVNLPGSHRPGSIGRPLPGVQWRIVDDTRTPVDAGAGKEGELQIRSASVMRGYHGAHEQPFTTDGWLKTGDLARLDADGFAHITGRIKELIISAGKNIHPS